MPDANRRIEELARRFVDELKSIAREEVVQILGGALSTATATSRARRPANGRRGRGEKRAPKALEALQAKALATIKAAPGKRVEELNRELGVKSGELALPLRKLVASKEIRTTGARRATRYFAASAKKGKKAKKAKSKR